MAIKLSDITKKRMMNYTIGDDQYKKILQLMLELEKKIESKNIEVRGDFTRELQKLNKPDDDFDHIRFQQGIEEQMQNLETHFKNQFMRRVEIVEDGIDSTVTRMDKFMATLSLDSERASKLEAALKDQVEVIGHINERVKLQGNQQEVLTDQVEQRLQVVRTELNGRLDGNVEALKKGINFLETDLNGTKKAASSNAADLGEFKATVERGFEETLNKQRELNGKVL